MTIQVQQVRRATVEDLPQLGSLWQKENLLVQELEKRFREFQVAEGPGGAVLAALGMQIAGQQGSLHSEVFLYPEHAETLREKLWERARIVATNHGLTRVWTQLAAPSWSQIGFQEATAEVLGRLPQEFASASQSWKCLQLREESATAVSLDKEFALFREAEKERTDRLFRQARALKLIAAVIALVVFLLVVVWAFFFFKMHRLPGR
jgi:N-acetylglutamate synthase-like GNAT family acetyltransferase